MDQYDDVDIMINRMRDIAIMLEKSPPHHGAAADLHTLAEFFERKCVPIECQR